MAEVRGSSPLGSTPKNNGCLTRFLASLGRGPNSFAGPSKSGAGCTHLWGSRHGSSPICAARLLRAPRCSHTSRRSASIASDYAPTKRRLRNQRYRLNLSLALVQFIFPVCVRSRISSTPSAVTPHSVVRAFSAPAATPIRRASAEVCP
jgi:hypothetical protein